MIYRIKLFVILILFLSIDIFAFAEDVNQVIVAKVNEMPISLEEFNREIEYHNINFERYTQVVHRAGGNMVIRSLGAPGFLLNRKVITNEDKIEYLKHMVLKKLFFYEALRRGLDKEENIRKLLDSATSDRDREDILMNALTNLIIEEIVRSITPQEIKDFYRIFKGRFRTSEQRHIREILVATEEEAVNISMELLSVDFGTLAKRYSKSSSADKGGDLGFISRDDQFIIPIPLWFLEAFSTNFKAGDTSSIIKDSDGYRIIKLEEIRKGKQLPFQETKESIKQIIVQLKSIKSIKEFERRLYQDAKTEIYEDRIK